MRIMIGEAFNELLLNYVYFHYIFLAIYKIPAFNLLFKHGIVERKNIFNALCCLPI